MRTSLSNHLRTAQVEVDSIAVVLGQQSRLNEHLWIIGTKLTHRECNTVICWQYVWNSVNVWGQLTQMGLPMWILTCVMRGLSSSHTSL